MAEVYRYGKSVIGKPDGMKTIGGFFSSIFESPTVLSFTSTSKDDTMQLLVRGGADDGKRLAVFVSLNGTEAVSTEPVFVFVDSVVVRGRRPNSGDVIIRDGSGTIVGQIDKGKCTVSKAEYRAGKQGASLGSYAVSVRANAPVGPVEVVLVQSSGERHIVVHSFYAPTDGGVHRIDIPPIDITPMEIVSVKASTDGTDVAISAWLSVVE